MDTACELTNSSGTAAAAPTRQRLDGALLETIAAGDKFAMQVLFQRHSVRVYRFVLRLIGNESVAEEIVSEVFLNVWRQAGTFEAKCQVTTWLLAIARHKAVSVQRRRSETHPDDDMAATVADPSEDAETVLDREDRGKIIRTEEELKDHVRRFKEFARYRDVDGDGIPYRTLPGLIDSPAAAYFTRGSGHSDRAAYTEKPEDYKNNMDRLARKFETARRYVPGPVVSNGSAAAIGVIAYGSSDFAVEEARVLLARRGLKTDYLRLRALPTTEEVPSFIASHDRVYVVDQNRDGQMYDLLRLEIGADAVKLRSIRHYDGFPLDAETVVEGIEAGEKN